MVNQGQPNDWKGQVGVVFKRYPLLIIRTDPVSGAKSLCHFTFVVKWGSGFYWKYKMI